ncbi:MAG TPA: hypothetical protein DDY78_14420 [Planctomycetales bacterium]|nr:hypothetical protein [Planctomycetales bacterium]
MGSLQHLLDALRAGDDSAREGLLQHTIGRCRELARRMLNKAWDLRQIDQTDDVAQKAMLRLYKTLAHVKPPDAAAFYGLAARQIRWVLGDLAREMGTAKVVGYRADLPEAEDPFSGPADLAEWSEFHEKIDGLPDEQREIFDLLFYEGLTQEEASAVLEMSVRSIKRRWQRARLSLAHALHGEWPRV